MSPDKLTDGRRRDLQSYGRRKGRKLSKRQRALLSALLPSLRVALPSVEGRQLDLVALFGKEDASVEAPFRVWLEIGFGGGEHLIWQARQNRDVKFIGCEPFVDGVVKLLDAIETCDLANIRILDDDARPLLRVLPAGSIERVFILFPDPWPKRKHRKRRLISRSMLDLLARVMTPGAQLRVATDIADYAAQILATVRCHHAFEWQASGPDDWRVRPGDWPKTRYEEKAGRDGRSCSYFIFVRR